MGIREDWQHSKEIVDTERYDERSRHQRLLMWRDVLFTIVPLVLVYQVLVSLLPMADTTRLNAYAALPAVLFFGGMLTMIVSAQWRRPYSPEFQRASNLRALAWWPLSVVVAGAVAYVPGRSLSDALSIATGVLLGGLLFAAFSLRRSRRNH